MIEERKAIISAFPRGSYTATSGLVSVDLSTGRVIWRYIFRQDDYFCSPGTGLPSIVRHARGIACDDGLIYVALFNSVVAMSGDLSSGDFRVVRRYTHPLAVDLHGIDIDDGRLAAVSTGTDTVLIWDIAVPTVCEVITVNNLDFDINADYRFPDQRPPSQIGISTTWRTAAPGTLHLNDVEFIDGGLIICSLTTIRTIAFDSLKVETLLRDNSAIFHDGKLRDNMLYITDASRGDVLRLNLDNMTEERGRVASPAEWFVRGLDIIEDRVYVLRSRLVPNRQLRVDHVDGSSRLEESALLGVSTLDIASLGLNDVTDFWVDGFPAGSVAYAIHC